MNNIKPLEFGKVYHIYNRGVNKIPIFRTNHNYKYFLHLYTKYIDPVADTYSWVLMKNHFHLLVRIKDLDESFNTLTGIWEPVRLKKLSPSRQFSHFFNAYARAFNLQEKRSGALFERPFKRIEVDNDQYFKHLVVYIHRNPIKHKIRDDVIDYPWSSYGNVVSIKPTFLSKEKVLGWFDSVGNFKAHHRRGRYPKELSPYLLESSWDGNELSGL